MGMVSGGRECGQGGEVPVGHGTEGDRVEGQSGIIVCGINDCFWPEPAPRYSLTSLVESGKEERCVPFPLQEELRGDIRHTTEHVSDGRWAEGGHQEAICITGSDQSKGFRNWQVK